MRQKIQLSENYKNRIKELAGIRPLEEINFFGFGKKVNPDPNQAAPAAPAQTQNPQDAYKQRFNTTIWPGVKAFWKKRGFSFTVVNASSETQLNAQQLPKEKNVVLLYANDPLKGFKVVIPQLSAKELNIFRSTGGGGAFPQNEGKVYSVKLADNNTYGVWDSTKD